MTTSGARSSAGTERSCPRADGPLSSGPRGRVPVIAGASLGVAGASAAAVIVLSAASSPPAFAVTTHRDGTVSVVIRRIDGIPGANHRLAQLGIRVRAVQVDAHCQAVVAPALRQVTVATLKRDHGAGWVGGVAGGVKAKIRPQQIARHRTLVIAAVPSKGEVRLVRGRSVRGAIPGCLPPVALLQSVTRGGKAQILSCGIRPLPPNHRIVVGPATNTTATNETTSTGPASGSTKTTGHDAATPQAAETVTTPTARHGERDIHGDRIRYDHRFSNHAEPIVGRAVRRQGAADPPGLRGGRPACPDRSRRANFGRGIPVTVRRGGCGQSSART